MGTMLGFILGLFIILIKKLLSWLPIAIRVCGIMLRHMLLLVDWILCLTMVDDRWIITNCVKPQMLVSMLSTVIGRRDWWPSESNCVDDDNQNTRNTIEDTACDRDELDNSLECSSDTDNNTDDDNELHESVSCCSSNDNGEERVIATAVPTVKEKLECPVECSESDGPQDQVLTVSKIPEELRKQILQEKVSQTVQEDIEGNSCDESEDEEDSKADCLDCDEEEEKFVFCGAVPDHSSDTKSDHGGKDEQIVTIKGVERADQQHNGEEANDNRKNQQTIMPLNPTSQQSAKTTDQVQRETADNHPQTVATFPGNTPND